MLRLLLVALAAIGAAVASPCTVGTLGGEMFPTIAAALAACPRDAYGGIELILSVETFHESALAFPIDLSGVNITTAGPLPPAYYPTNNASIVPVWQGVGHQVLNTSMYLNFTGLAIDAQGSPVPLFVPLLQLNNFTALYCWFGNSHSQRFLEIEAPDANVTWTLENVQFEMIWGAAWYVQGLTSLYVQNAFLNRVGGYMNMSASFSKLAWVSWGQFVISGYYQFLVYDYLGPPCSYCWDPACFVLCNVNQSMCYSEIDTLLTNPKCPMQTFSFFNRTVNQTQTYQAYAQACRVYVPCECAPVEFYDNSTGQNVVLSVGDVYYPNGMILPCVALQNATLFSNPANLTFVQSLAGTYQAIPGNGAAGVPPSPPLFQNETGYALGSPVIGGTAIFLSYNLTDVNGTWLGAYDFWGRSIQNANATMPFGNITNPSQPCVCNQTFVPPSAVNITCDYAVTQQLSNLNSVNWTLPDLGFGLVCANGTVECCLDLNCSLSVACGCATTTNFTSDGYAPLNGTYDYAAFLPLANDVWYQALGTYNVQLEPSYAIYTGMIQAYIWAGGTFLVFPLSQIWTDMAFLLDGHACVLSGSCPYPQLPATDPRIDLQCANGTVFECPCDDSSITKGQVPYLVSDNTAGIEIANVPDTVSLFVVTNVTAMGLPYGALVDRLTYQLFFNNSHNLPFSFFDEVGVLRLMWQSFSQFSGTLHDMAYGNTSFPDYLFFCDALCPQKYTTAGDFDCFVDNAAQTPLPANVFAFINDADSAGCKAALVFGTENYYPEQLEIYSLTAIVSWNTAAVVGSLHTVGINGLLVRGLRFVPTGTSQPLWQRDTTVSKPVRTLWMWNCDFQGGGSQSGIFAGPTWQPYGIFASGTLELISIRYSLLYNWQLIMTEVGNIVGWEFTWNQVQNTNARLMNIFYYDYFDVRYNTLLNSRGANNLPFISMFAFTSINSASCPEPLCYFIDNLQFANIGASDQSDIGAQFVGGNVPLARFKDNQFLKANVGIRFRSVSTVTLDTIGQFVLQNALNRPSNFPATAVAKGIALNADVYGLSDPNTIDYVNALLNNIHDWEFEFFYSLPYLPFFSFFLSGACNYPCSQYQPFNFSNTFCEFNNNYGIGNSADYGYQTFSNGSQAIYFCRATTSSQKNLAELIITAYGTGWGGSRLYTDTWTLLFPVSFQGLRLPWETYDPPGGIADPRVVVYTLGNSMLADPMTMADMEFRFWIAQVTIPGLFYTTSDTNPVYVLNWTRCTFSAKGVIPHGLMCGIYAEVGLNVDYQNSRSSSAISGSDDDVVPVSAAAVTVDSCIFRDFKSYQQTRASRFSQNAGLLVNVSATTFPYAQPMKFMFLDSLGSPQPGVTPLTIPPPNLYGYGTLLNVSNILAYDIDGQVLYTAGAQWTWIDNFTCYDCGGKAPNTLGLFFIAADYAQPTSFIYLLNSFQNQTQPVPYPTSSQSQFVYGSAYYIMGVPPTGLLCIENVSMDALSIGVRIADGNQTKAINCFSANNSHIWNSSEPLYDYASRLWRNENEGLNATVCDIAIGQPYQDFQGTLVCCNGGCLPPPPASCYVSLTSQEFNPTNPYWNIYLFGDPNLALKYCAAPSRQVIMLANDPPTPYVVVIDPDYNITDQARNMSSGIVPSLVCQQFSNQTATEIDGCGHTLQAGALLVSNCFFRNTCGGATPTWQTSCATMNSSMLQLTYNNFSGEGDTELLFSGQVENGFAFDYNYAYGFKGFDVFQLEGCSCNETQITMSHNKFVDASDSAVNITGVCGYTYDYNLFIDSGCQNDVRAALSYVASCPRNASSPPTSCFVQAQYNNASSSNSSMYVGIDNQPLGGYCTAFWFDNVNQLYQSVNMYGNTVLLYPVGCRFTGQIPTPPLDNCQVLPRSYSLTDQNYYCWGNLPNGFDITLAPPEMDAAIIAQPEAECKWYCNRGCPYLSGLGTAILFGVPLALLLLCCCFCICFGPSPIGSQRYYSATLQRWVHKDQAWMGGWDNVDGPHELATLRVRSNYAKSVEDMA